MLALIFARIVRRLLAGIACRAARFTLLGPLAMGISGGRAALRGLMKHR